MTTRRTPSRLAERVRERLVITGMSQSELARRSGVERGSVHDLLQGRKATVGEPALQRFAAVLTTSVAYLSGEIDDPTRKARPMRMRPPPRLPSYIMQGGSPSHLPTDDGVGAEEHDNDPELVSIPALDPAAPLEGFFLRARTRPLPNGAGASTGRGPIPLYRVQEGRLRVDCGPIRESMPRPLPLARVPGAFALVWLDDSLAPRIRMGETIVVAPTLEVRPGDDVVVWTRAEAPDTSVVVGILAAARRDRFVLTDLGGGPDHVVASHAVIRIHRIAMIIAAGIQ